MPTKWIQVADTTASLVCKDTYDIIDWYELDQRHWQCQALAEVSIKFQIKFLLWPSSNVPRCSSLRNSLHCKMLRGWVDYAEKAWASQSVLQPSHTEEMSFYTHLHCAGTFVLGGNYSCLFSAPIHIAHFMTIWIQFISSLRKNTKAGSEVKTTTAITPVVGSAPWSFWQHVIFFTNEESLKIWKLQKMTCTYMHH